MMLAGKSGNATPDTSPVKQTMSPSVLDNPTGTNRIGCDSRLPGKNASGGFPGSRTDGDRGIVPDSLRREVWPLGKIWSLREIWSLGKVCTLRKSRRLKDAFDHEQRTVFR